MFLHEECPAYGSMLYVSKRISRIVARNPGPFTYWGSATYLIGDNNDIALVDPGPDDDAHLSALLGALDGHSLTAILVTHRHGDHAGLAMRLAAATGAPVYAGPAPAHLAGGDEASLMALDAKPLNEGDMITGSDWSLRAMHTPGHTPDHFCFLDTDTGALFTGDHIMGWSTSAVMPPAGHMGDYMTSLARIAALKPNLLFPTHGPAVPNPDAFIKALIDHRLAREKAVLAAIVEGAAHISEICTKAYGAIADGIRPAAELSTRAHIIKLVEERRTKPGDLEDHYHLVK